MSRPLRYRFRTWVARVGQDMGGAPRQNWPPKGGQPYALDGDLCRGPKDRISVASPARCRAVCRPLPGVRDFAEDRLQVEGAFHAGGADGPARSIAAAQFKPHW